MKRKGQAAFEFLTTYGWAFLVLAGVIGVMVYFGLADFSSRVPSSCTFDKAFNCESGFVLDDGSFAIEFTNQEARAINITKVLCIFPQSETGLLLHYETHNVPLARGDNITISCDYTALSGGTSLGLKKKDLFKMKVMYTFDEDQALPRVANAELVQDVAHDRAVFEDYYVDAQPSFDNREDWPLT